MEVTAAGVADCLALRALVEAYAFAVDRRDAHAFVGLFTADATLTVYDATGAATGGYNGRNELVTLPARLERYDVTLHLVHNQEILIDGPTGTGEVYCAAHHITGVGADASDRVLMIRYVDQYAREPDQWLFRTREVRVQWAEQHTVQR